VKDSFKTNTSLSFLGSLISGNIWLPRGHFKLIEGASEAFEYSIAFEAVLDEDFAEARWTDLEAKTQENVPDRQKPRRKLANNPIDIFMSANQVRQKI